MYHDYKTLRIIRHMRAAELQHRLKYANTDEEKQALRVEIGVWTRYR